MYIRLHTQHTATVNDIRTSELCTEVQCHVHLIGQNPHKCTPYCVTKRTSPFSRKNFQIRSSPQSVSRGSCCLLHINRSDAPIVPRCCRLGQCEWSTSPDTESAVGASSGGHREVHRAILNMFNIARRRRRCHEIDHPPMPDHPPFANCSK